MNTKVYIFLFKSVIQNLHLFKEYGAFITGDSLNEVRIIGCATSVLLIGIVLIGMEWEAKVRNIKIKLSQQILTSS